MKKMRRIRMIYWAFKKRITIEIILSVITLAIFLLTRSGLLLNNLLFAGAMMVLAGFYFLTSFLPTIKADAFTRFVSRLSGIIASIVIVGILYSLFGYEGSGIMLETGGIALSVAFVVFLISTFRRTEAYILHLMVRSVILMVLAWYVFTNPVTIAV